MFFLKLIYLLSINALQAALLLTLMHVIFATQAKAVCGRVTWNLNVILTPGNNSNFNNVLIFPGRFAWGVPRGSQTDKQSSGYQALKDLKDL